MKDIKERLGFVNSIDDISSKKQGEDIKIDDVVRKKNSFSESDWSKGMDPAKLYVINSISEDKVKMSPLELIDAHTFERMHTSETANISDLQKYVTNWFTVISK